ncbi:MAG: phytoene/squalene synthase family protein, partial [Pseudomonadota bacterium]
WAVLSAARIYGGIGRKVLDRGQLAWDTRTRISAPEKAAHIVAAFFEALWNRPAPPTEPILWSRHDFRPVAGW